MTNNKAYTDIKTLAADLLANAENPAEAERIIREIYAQFQQLTGLTGYEEKLEYLAAVPTAKGAALGLNHAAQCLLDFKRTTKFLTSGCCYPGPPGSSSGADGRSLLRWLWTLCSLRYPGCAFV